MGILRSITSKMAPSLAGALSACGGLNIRRSRFAARLLQDDLSDGEFMSISHSIIFANGVRRTTAPARNAVVLQELFSRNLLPNKQQLRVLEVGASAGLDALSNHKLLTKHYEISDYTLGDLHHALLYDQARGLLFDEDHTLLQVDLGVAFFSIYFNYLHSFQKLFSLPEELVSLLLRRLFPFDEGRSLQQISLLYPKARDCFSTKRVDVFGPIPGEQDLIICMHLLVPRYFSADKIDEGARNLCHALSINGSLLLGATEEYKLFTKISETELEVRSSNNLSSTQTMVL